MTGFARFLVAAAILGVATAGCSEGQPQQAKGPPPPPTVTVAKPARKLVVDEDEYVGRFVAVESVEIRARIGGYLEKINFTDGQMVKEGDVLFVIDRRPYRHVLEQAKANLAQARANLAYAQSDLDRGALLVKDKTITQQTYDQRLQTKNVAEAAVKAQEEAVAILAVHQRIPGRVDCRTHVGFAARSRNCTVRSVQDVGRDVNLPRFGGNPDQHGIFEQARMHGAGRNK